MAYYLVIKIMIRCKLVNSLMLSFCNCSFPKCRTDVIFRAFRYYFLPMVLSQTVPSSEMLLNIYHLLTSRDKYVLPMQSFVRVIPVIIPVATTLPASVAIKGINGSERLWFIVLLHLLTWVSFGTSLLIVALIRTKKS